MGRKAGDPVGDLFGGFIALQMRDHSADTEDLFQVGEIYIVVELATCPDLAHLQAAMAFIDRLVLRGENPSSEVPGYLLLGFAGCP